jgi:hypothetical protein
MGAAIAAKMKNTNSDKPTRAILFRTRRFRTPVILFR